MMDDEVLLLDREEAIAAIIAHALREARIIGLELEIGPVDVHEFGEFVQSEHAIEHEDLIGHNVELCSDEIAHTFRHEAVELEPDDGAAATPLQRAFEQQDEIFRLFLDFEIAVTNDAEHPRAAHRITGKQRRYEHVDEHFERHEPLLAVAVGQFDETFHLRGQANQCLEVFVVAWPREFERHGETEIGDEGEGMRGIDGERRQHWKNVEEEMLFEPVVLCAIKLVRFHEGDGRGVQFPAQFAPAALLLGRKQVHSLTNLAQLFGRGEAVFRRGADAGAHLSAQAGHTNHEEFIEVVG